MPLSFKEERFIVDGKLFSSRQMTKQVTGLMVDYGFRGGISLGAHQHRILSEEKLRDGRTRTGKHGEIGLHASINFGSLSAGVRHGKTSTSVQETTDSDGVTTETMTMEQYSGKLVAELKIGGRSRSFQPLPAFQSHKNKITQRFHKDGTPLSSKYHCPVQQLSKGSKGSNIAGAPAAHTDFVEMTYDNMKSKDGRDEHIHIIKEEKHSKRKFFFLNKKWTDVVIDGSVHEQATSMSDTKVVQGNIIGDEYHTQVQSDVAEWKTVDTTTYNKKGKQKGKTQHSEVLDAKYSTTRDIYSLVDPNVNYGQRDISQTVESSMTTGGLNIELRGVEKDTVRFVDKTPVRNESGKVTSETLTREFISGSSVLKGETPVQVGKFSGGHTRSRESVEINANFTDLRSEQKGADPAKSSAAGKDRTTQGTIARTINTTTRSTGKGFNLSSETKATTKVHNFTGETSNGVSTMDIAPTASTVINVEVKESQGLFTAAGEKAVEVCSLDSQGNVAVDSEGKELKSVTSSKYNKLSTSGSAGL